MDKYVVTVEGLEDLQSAIKRNPEVIKENTSKFFVRALAVYRAIIWNNPWKVGMYGGGVPVATGNLRDTHITQINTWEAYIKPTAEYAKFVHKKRPWLEYAYDTGRRQVEVLETELLTSIVADLAN